MRQALPFIQACKHKLQLPPRPRQMRELHLINLGLERLPPSLGRLTALEELWWGWAGMGRL